MSQTKHRNTKADADAHKKALQHVMTQRSHWSVPKITAFCKTCKNLPEIIDFNIKIEDAYQNFWKNDMRTVVRFAKRFIELLKWITAEDHRPIIVLNFAYYDFALIQKIYTRFYHIESIVKRMQIAMSVIEIFQITPTLSSLNDAQRSHLNKIQRGIYKTWMAFWSDDSSIKFFNISSVNLSKALSYDITNNNNNNNHNNHNIDDIDDLLFDEKQRGDDEVDIDDDNNSIFTIDENEDLIEQNNRNKKEKELKDKDKDFDDEDITDQALKIDSYLPHNDRSGIPIIRTINIGDELNNINKQLVFISDIIAWLKQQIIRIKPKLQHKTSNELRNNDKDTFNAIIVCLRKLLLDASAITSLCVSTPNNNDINNNNDNNNDDNDNDKEQQQEIKNDDNDIDDETVKLQQNTNTSSYLRMITDIVRNLTDECCKSNKNECIQIFKSILADVASNKLTHHLVVQLLEVFVDRISNHQYKIDSMCQQQQSNDNTINGINDNDEIESKSNKFIPKNKNKYIDPKYIFNVRVLNCEYFVDHKIYGNDIANAYSDYLQHVISSIITILNKRRFRILYILSSSSYNQLPTNIINTNHSNDILSSPSTTITHIGLNNCSSFSSPKSSQHSISPLPIDQTLSLHPPNTPNKNIQNNDDPSIPRIHHASPLNLNKIALKNNDHTIITNPDSSSSSSSSSSSVSIDNNNNNTNNDYKYGRLMIAVDVLDVINHSELDLNTVVSIVSDEIVETIIDGTYRLNIRFYPIYHSCKHRYDTDFFYHRGLSLRDEINNIINDDSWNSNNNKKKKKKKNKKQQEHQQNNALMKSVLCLSLRKQPTDDIIFERFRLLNKLKDILISVHGNHAKYEIFGSMATKLDHIESDLDVSIHLPSDNILSFDNYFKNNNLNISDLTMEVKQHRIQKILKPIYLELIKIPNIKAIFLEHATVPIVKLTDEQNGMQSDISVCLTQSVIKTKLIKKYVSIDWRVKPLVLSIKHWVKSRKLNNTHRGDLNSFGFTLMIIHYLQCLNPAILPILEINKAISTGSEEPDWIKSDKFVNFGNKNNKHIGQLFTGFFTYYHTKFNPKIHAISITNTIRKHKINGFLNKNLCHLQNNHNDILIVLDPLDDTDNIGRRVTDVTWNNMQKEFKLAADITNNDNNNQ